ncbi:alpha-methylacyl-CoA racemase-like [Tigriopus californicus]|uniref:alpha-methylacyl-CoA racemase-like n=1 Tax=Tigriopus californicus TaxID=6832 RepID=UPI0027D9F03E|nr:alpha-methylacyl-CoA racemase-like [Tigriopus californicus]XP_059099685.1 alpha-methylacyl-CoA racemase-like [Tigriopus californicus]|eukprot:TCALIF_11924-PA protein Name:"Similar to AMACR Alpha-methylacyl-CoA racemase (Homo sapiens)" AED:0.03 eAED:0.03 QI:373/1/1/1/1/1/5/388/385
MALKGVKVLELAGLAPAPFCGMILSDFGADVIRVDRTDHGFNQSVTDRGKRSIQIDLKHTRGKEMLKEMCLKSDVLLEPFRAGVMEKLGLGPSVMLEDNPKLIYARLTGYGQFGAFAKKAGHDINYIALSGMLSKLGRKDEPPYAPINLLADFAGGGLTCAMGIMAALIERHKTGHGQVIDANMTEGAAYVGSWIYKSQDRFFWGKPRGENFLDSGSHFYETYATKDGKFLAVGAIEPQFYDQLLIGLGLTSDELPQFGNPDELKAKLQRVFMGKTRDEWTQIFDKLDACVTPVLEMEETSTFAHHQERQAFAPNAKGQFDPIPAPRLSNHESSYSDIVARAEPEMGADTNAILREFNFSSAEIEVLLDDKIVQQASQPDLKSKL